MPNELNPFLMRLYARAFASQDPAQVQVSFGASVLEKYRTNAGFALLRTNTVGRIKREGGWTLDVGIAEGEDQVHASLRDLMYTLPEEEREHWARHVVTPPLSQMFVQMRLTPGSCFDDGELRAWE
jgi:hypothetical protein